MLNKVCETERYARLVGNCSNNPGIYYSGRHAQTPSPAFHCPFHLYLARVHSRSLVHSFLLSRVSPPTRIPKRHRYFLAYTLYVYSRTTTIDSKVSVNDLTARARITFVRGRVRARGGEKAVKAKLRNFMLKTPGHWEIYTSCLCLRG